MPKKVTLWSTKDGELYSSEIESRASEDYDAAYSKLETAIREAFPDVDLTVLHRFEAWLAKDAPELAEVFSELADTSFILRTSTRHGCIVKDAQELILSKSQIKKAFNIRQDFRDPDPSHAVAIETKDHAASVRDHASAMAKKAKSGRGPRTGRARRPAS